jgi:hypothetical protein
VREQTRESSSWGEIVDGNLLRYVIHFEVHRGTTAGKELGKELINIFESYGFDTKFIVAVVTDTTGNMNTFGCHLIIPKELCTYNAWITICTLWQSTRLTTKNLPGADGACDEIG